VKSLFHTVCFIPEEITTSNHYTGGDVDLIAGLIAVAERRNPDRN
jgi:hypothetical protein